MRLIDLVTAFSFGAQSIALTFSTGFGPRRIARATSNRGSPSQIHHPVERPTNILWLSKSKPMTMAAAEPGKAE
jgi:hypothetical protein